MTLIAILVGTFVAGVSSVWLAAWLSFGVLARYTTHMLSLAAGVLMATSFMNLLPEAFKSQISADQLFTTLLLGLVFFFLLDKAELWHHGHEHHGSAQPGNPDPLSHDHGDSHSHSGNAGGWAVLAGDSVHGFGDGILIAAAFMTDIRLGIFTALAVMVHEVPHQMGDLMVLRQTSSSRRVAIIKVSLSGAVTVLGGVVGYALVNQLNNFLPFFVVTAASSFIYVALADLIPQLQKRVTAKETCAQIAWLAIGIGLVMLVRWLVVE
ncbi:MAG: ZIP family metal transporter [Polaromonas sp.]